MYELNSMPAWLKIKDLKDLPAWLTVADDAAKITLSRPVDLNGIKQDRITLRAPTVRDIRAANTAVSDDEEQRELVLFASLAGVGPKDLEGLKVTDYQRLQAGYFCLVQDDGI